MLYRFHLQNTARARRRRDQEVHRKGHAMGILMLEKPPCRHLRHAYVKGSSAYGVHLANNVCNLRVHIEGSVDALENNEPFATNVKALTLYKG